YAERLDVNQPLEFSKDGKVVHKIRPVEAYILDEKGEPILTFDEHESLRTAQAWRLNRNAPGAAEMSANLGDLADAPEGDVVIDPSMTFIQYGSFNVATMDAELAYESSSNLGGNTTIPLSLNDRAVLACDLAGLGYNKAVTNIQLKIYLQSKTMSGSPQIRAYNIQSGWWESSVDWFERYAGTYWDSYGADFSFDNPGMISEISSTGWVSIDLTEPFNARYSVFSEINPKGFLLKIESGSSSGYLTFLSKEYTNVSYR
ncbi:MAG: DNRLRE domain-containing protein, partial [Candidatus Hinthialibacter sp.]